MTLKPGYTWVLFRKNGLYYRTCSNSSNNAILWWLLQTYDTPYQVTYHATSRALSVESNVGDSDGCFLPPIDCRHQIRSPSKQCEDDWPILIDKPNQHSSTNINHAYLQLANEIPEVSRRFHERPVQRHDEATSHFGVHDRRYVLMLEKIHFTTGRQNIWFITIKA